MAEPRVEFVAADVFPCGHCCHGHGLGTVPNNTVEERRFSAASHTVEDFIPRGKQRLISRPCASWFSDLQRSAWLSFKRVEAPRLDIHFSVDKFLHLRSDCHVRID